MATIKSFTDLEQSKKLAEILPLESADMYYLSGDEYDICFGSGVYKEIADWFSDGTSRPADIPCWSLASLLNVLPIIDLYSPSLKMKLTHKYYVEVYLHKQKRYLTTDDYDNPVDACVTMIERLHEFKML